MTRSVRPFKLGLALGGALCLTVTGRVHMGMSYQKKKLQGENLTEKAREALRLGLSWLPIYADVGGFGFTDIFGIGENHGNGDGHEGFMGDGSGDGFSNGYGDEEGGGDGDDGFGNGDGYQQDVNATLVTNTTTTYRFVDASWVTDA